MVYLARGSLHSRVNSYARHKAYKTCPHWKIIISSVKLVVISKLPFIKFFYLKEMKHCENENKYFPWNFFFKKNKKYSDPHLNPNLTRGGGLNSPFYIFSWKITPLSSIFYSKNTKQTTPQNLGQYSILKSLHYNFAFSKFENLSLKRVISSMGFWGPPPLVGYVFFLNRVVWLGLCNNFVYIYFIYGLFNRRTYFGCCSRKSSGSGTLFSSFTSSSGITN